MQADEHVRAPEQHRYAAQIINISVGDNSPVTLTAPDLHARSSGTAGEPRGERWWSSTRVWTVIGSVAGVVGAFVAVIALR
ncbi:hypothetical protein [Streptomyces sp. C]|uniref:hypothetical protein n=1 Tax=Streptomyces TaxID=1883 RepID=UPI0001DEEE10|nr:hypothetical protein [Streptomyces sp. C]EFL13869.1 predicted protein [Streptomyces sp. C]